jgi:hypothetical protein
VNLLIDRFPLQLTYIFFLRLWLILIFFFCFKKRAKFPSFATKQRNFSSHVSRWRFFVMFWFPREHKSQSQFSLIKSTRDFSISWIIHKLCNMSFLNAQLEKKTLVRAKIIENLLISEMNHSSFIKARSCFKNLFPLNL